MAEFQNLTKDANDPPLVAIFPSGIPNVIADQTNFPFQYMAPKDPKKSSGAFLYGESENLRFIGTTQQPFNLSKNNFNYSIGYFNPKKPNTVKLVQAHGVFTVKQLAAGDVAGPDDGSIKELEFNAARREVTEQFGARKNKRQLRSQEAGRVNIDADDAALQALDTQLSAIGADATFEATLSQSEANMLATHRKSLPPFNLTATNPENIYTFESMLPRNLWKDLNAPKMLALRLDIVKTVKKVDIDPKKKKSTKMGDDDDDDELFSSSDDDSDGDDDDDDDDDAPKKKNKGAVQRLMVAEDVDETTSTLHLSTADQALVAAMPKFIRIRRDLIATKIRQAQGVGNAVNKTIILNEMNQLAFFYILYRLLTKRRGQQRIGPHGQLHEILEVSEPIARHIKFTLFKNYLDYNDEVFTRVQCHFLTMALLCGDSFTLEQQYVGEIADALKTTAVNLNKVFLRIGATVNANGRIRLTAPLKLPGFGRAAPSRK